MKFLWTCATTPPRDACSLDLVVASETETSLAVSPPSPPRLARAHPSPRRARRRAVGTLSGAIVDPGTRRGLAPLPPLAGTAVGLLHPTRIAPKLYANVIGLSWDGWGLLDRLYDIQRSFVYLKQWCLFVPWLGLRPFAGLLDVSRVSHDVVPVVLSEEGLVRGVPASVLAAQRSLLGNVARVPRHVKALAMAVDLVLAAAPGEEPSRAEQGKLGPPVRVPRAIRLALLAAAELPYFADVVRAVGKGLVRALPGALADAANGGAAVRIRSFVREKVEKQGVSLVVPFCGKGGGAFRETGERAGGKGVGALVYVSARILPPYLPWLSPLPLSLLM